MKKIFLVLFTIMLVCQIPFHASATGVTGPNRVTGQDKVNTKVPITMTTAPMPLDIMVPTAFLIEANKLGDIVAAPWYFPIDNYSIAPIKIVSFKWTGESSVWQLTDFDSQENPPENSRTFALGLDFKVGDTTYTDKDMTVVNEENLLAGHVTPPGDIDAPMRDRSILFNYTNKRLGKQTVPLGVNETTAGKFSVIFAFDDEE